MADEADEATEKLLDDVDEESKTLPSNATDEADEESEQLISNTTDNVDESRAKLISNAASDTDLELTENHLQAGEDREDENCDKHDANSVKDVSEPSRRNSDTSYDVSELKSDSPTGKKRAVDFKDLNLTLIIPEAPTSQEYHPFAEKRPLSALVLYRNQRRQRLLEKQKSQHGTILCGLAIIIVMLGIGVTMILLAKMFDIEDLYIVGGIFVFGGAAFTAGFTFVRCETMRSGYADDCEVLYKPTSGDEAFMSTDEM